METFTLHAELKITAFIFTVGRLILPASQRPITIGTMLYTDVYLKYQYMCYNDCKWFRLQKLIFVVHLRWIL